MATTDPAVTENNSLVVMRDGALATYIEQLGIALRARGYDLSYTMQAGNREQYQWSGNEYTVNIQGATRYYERTVGYGTTLQIDVDHLAESMIGSGAVTPPVPTATAPAPALVDTTAIVPGSGVTPSTVSGATPESNPSGGTAGATVVGGGGAGLSTLAYSMRAALVAGGYSINAMGNVYEWNYWYQRCSEYKGSLPTVEQLQAVSPQLTAATLYDVDKAAAIIGAWLLHGSGSGSAPSGPGETPVPDSGTPTPPKDKSNKVLIGIGALIVLAALFWKR
jgi:hypothetical protein